METEFVRLPKVEYDALLRRIENLQSQVEFFGQHRTLALGMSGERLVASQVGGALTGHKDSADVVLQSGQLVEVKRAKISIPMAAKPNSGKRWIWHKVFGQNNAKQYDWLVLIGEADERYKAFYLSKDSPFVAFILPYRDVDSVVSGGGNTIVLSTNPLNKAGRAAFMFEKYQVDAGSLELALRSIM